MDKSINQAVT